MKTRLLSGFLIGAGLAWCAALQVVVPVAAAPAASCATLASISLPDTTIKTAEEVAGPAFTPPIGGALNGLPKFCRVAGTTKTAVNFEVWLPVEKWNGKYQGVGNGANGGSIVYGAMAAAVRRGYATSSTDTGHSTTNARDGEWAVGHPELLADFGYRAIHVTAENAKQLVSRYYGQGASQSYFMSCSTGGRQALMEAQRFPEDYNGIIAGAPAANWTRFQTGGHLWVALAMNKDPESYMPASKLPILADAVNAACDKLDGIADGVLNDPRQCNFDPEVLMCRDGKDAPSCLTPKQVRAVKDIWAGSRNRTGVVYPGYMPGAESAGGWASYMTGTGPLSGNHWEQSDNTLKYFIFENASWDFRTFDYNKDLEFALKKTGKTFDAFDADLTKFRQRGNKLIMYHGWNDPSISPLNTIEYYNRVVGHLMNGKNGSRDEAETKAQQQVRLFMVPGMLHCSGGPGASNFDMLTALEDWVEHDRAPERVIASHSTNGVQDRTRPLCVYPKVAIYSGTGSTNDAANFSCQLPK